MKRYELKWRVSNRLELPRAEQVHCKKTNQGRSIKLLENEISEVSKQSQGLHFMHRMRMTGMGTEGN